MVRKIVPKRTANNNAKALKAIRKDKRIKTETTVVRIGIPKTKIVAVQNKIVNPKDDNPNRDKPAKTNKNATNMLKGSEIITVEEQNKIVNPNDDNPSRDEPAKTNKNAINNAINKLKNNEMKIVAVPNHSETIIVVKQKTDAVSKIDVPSKTVSSKSERNKIAQIVEMKTADEPIQIVGIKLMKSVDTKRNKVEERKTKDALIAGGQMTDEETIAETMIAEETMETDVTNSMTVTNKDVFRKNV